MSGTDVSEAAEWAKEDENEWWYNYEDRRRPDNFPSCCNGCTAALACLIGKPILYFLVCGACGHRLAAFEDKDGLRALSYGDDDWFRALECPNVPAFRKTYWDDCDDCQPMTDDDGNIIPPEEPPDADR